MEILKKILVVAGPCATESREQVLATAKEIAKLGIPMFRAGVWKPRTLPGGFEGIGAEALQWLQEVQKSTKMSVAVEVARAEHVRLSLNAGISTLWLGSRTTSNPFAVQEIADAIAPYLKHNSKIKVLVKNPLTPDTDLWSGAVERIKNAGVNEIVLVHRGFTSYERSIFRNVPLWSIALQMHKRYPTLPLLCDPSHIAGNRKYIEQISQQALDLAFDGLMVEVHNNPNTALSDASQQLSPAELEQMLYNLKIKEDTPLDSKEKVAGNKGDTKKLHIKDIGLLREEIDQIDSKILSLLAERIEVAKRIGEYKKENDMPLYQDDRHNTMLEQRAEDGAQKGLSKEFVKRLMEVIHSESLENQINNDSKKS